MIYALSDIHGHGSRFDSIMEQIKLQTEDTLYVLGDVIDRGEDSISLLLRIMGMPNAKMLLGNHEHMMLDVIHHPRDPELLERWYNNGGCQTYAAYKKLPCDQQVKIVSFLESLPINIDVTVNETDYLLVHGIPANMDTVLSNMDPDYFENFYGGDITFCAVWERIGYYHTRLPEGKTVIFGHTPTERYQLDVHPMEVWYGDHRIGIDCGAAYPDGRLACMRLDDGAVYYSAQSRKGSNDGETTQ